MKKLLKTLILFALFCQVPFTFLFFGYWYYDPFSVLNFNGTKRNSIVISNRDYNSTEVLIRNFDKIKYNSFIFGSSRTMGYKPSTWQKYLNKGDKVLVYDASEESIYGIYKKMIFLDSKNIKIDNALITLCTDVTFKKTKNEKGHLFIKHPLISGESKFNFQFTFLKAYFNPKFLLRFYAFQILKEYRPFMSGYLDSRIIQIDSITNELIILDQETEITQRPDEYYSKRKNLFYDREKTQPALKEMIHKEELFMLTEIKRILDKNKTNYKVVINPIYDQSVFSTTDKGILQNMFGSNLYDFSGKNSFTESKTNYYEHIHFRPLIGDSILQIIYSKK